MTLDRSTTRAHLALKVMSEASADNIRKMIYIMWAVQDNPSPIAVISLNTEKIIVWVEWQYLLSTQECLNFGDKFTNWICLIYNHSQASVLTNGVISPSFELGRGTRQGDLLSVLLFAIALEPLAVSI